MTLTIETQPVPLQTDARGVIRVSGTRVTLDTLIGFYQQGYSAEQLAESFDTVPLADIYAVIGYYLKHREAVDSYLAEGEQAADQLRQKIETEYPSVPFKERLLARKRSMEG